MNDISSLVSTAVYCSSSNTHDDVGKVLSVVEIQENNTCHRASYLACLLRSLIRGLTSGRALFL